MNGHSVVFGPLVQKLEQITLNSSTLQDDQNKWSQCSIPHWLDLLSTSRQFCVPFSKKRHVNNSIFNVSIKVPTNRMGEFYILSKSFHYFVVDDQWIFIFSKLAQIILY